MAASQTAPDVASAMANHDFSISAMFLNADLVVQAVIILLIAASLWTWTVIFTKFQRLRALNKMADDFEKTFWSCKSVEELHQAIRGKTNDPFSTVFSTAMREWNRSSPTKLQNSNKFTSLQERLERVMRVTMNREIEQIEKHVGSLASIGSTAPFIGLFGTVWGIMNSFMMIGVHQNTSLAVVAPGISEALFATALGLVAAIPAVLAYNKISSTLNEYGNRLDAFTEEFSAIISRQLEEAA